MASRLCNTIFVVLTGMTFLLSVLILGSGIWLATRGDVTRCEPNDLWSSAIVLGVFLMVITLAGLVGAVCRVTWLLWVYLVAMLVLIVVLLCSTIYVFVVTGKGGAGEVVPGRGYREYRLGDYSTQLQKGVQGTTNWNRIKNCLQLNEACKSKKQTAQEFASSNLTPIQSGCCKPPTSCGYTYVSATNWTRTATNSTDPDCKTWSNGAAGGLCYDCQSCKAGVVATVKQDWRRDALINVIFLVFLVVVYAIGCCVFRNSRRDNKPPNVASGMAAMGTLGR